MEARSELGALYIRQTQYQKAEAVLKEAVEKDPQHGESWRQLGLLYSDLNRPEEAAKMLRQVLAINPLHPEALYNLANVLLALGQTTEAEHLQNRFERLGRLHDHINQLQQTLDATPANVAARLRSGACLSRAPAVGKGRSPVPVAAFYCTHPFGGAPPAKRPLRPARQAR